MKTIGKYKIDEILFEQKFTNGCSPLSCDTTCCKSGVYLDPTDMEKVLAHSSEIKKYMDETQNQDLSVWFDLVKTVDIDYPSGFCYSTNVVNDKCAFLRKDGKCSIQVYGTESKLGAWSLKPFYCIAFPISVDDGFLTFDDYRQGEAKCCSVYKENGTSIVKACKDELIFVLGEEDYKKLDQMDDEYQKNKF